MATLPEVNTTVTDTSGAVAQGTDVICVMSPVPTNADMTPRQFGSANAIYTQHGFSPGVQYSALHFARPGTPVVFVGLPIATPGTVGREDTSGNSGTSVTTVSAGGSGVLAEHDGYVEVAVGGTIGTDSIILLVSLNGGLTKRRVRLGTGSSYTFDYYGVSIAFAAGTLVAGDVVHTWYGSAPRSDATGWATAFDNMAAAMLFFRTILLCQDFVNSTEAQAFLDEVESYDTAHDRFVYARAGVYDRTPQAELSSTTVRMTGSPSITFAEVGATGDTITRSTGSFVTDGLLAGDLLTVAGSTSNNGAYAAGVVTVAATVLTLDDDDLVDEGPVGGVTITAEGSLTFDNGASTIVRNRGSWLDDGFRADQTITVSSTVSNNTTFVIDTVTATTITTTVAPTDEVIGMTVASVTAGQTKAAWMAALDTAFGTIDDAPRISLAAGRGRVTCPFTQWAMRQSPGWAASLIEYSNDLHISTWWKELGPTGFDLNDTNQNLVEWDDRIDGKAGTTARFTCLRTFGNGPRGSFIAQSLTRAVDASLLSHTHNMAVVNLAQTTMQLVAERWVGRSMQLNKDGTATKGSLSVLSMQANSALGLALLQDTRGQGARASYAKYTPSTDDILNVAEPILTGVLELVLNGTLHTINTTIRVLAGGQE